MSLKFARTKLDSGATVVTEQMSEVRSVSAGFWFDVGSRDEPGPLAGTSHFLEHLLFKGTPTRSAKDIADAFDAVGGDVNAFTGKEYTCYYARVLDDDLSMALDLLTDMITNSLIDPDELESERKVILEEIAMHEDDPDELVHDLFSRAMWDGPPLGHLRRLGRRRLAGRAGPAVRGHALPRAPVVQGHRAPRRTGDLRRD